uniref:Ubiquitin carboxyl-terminal hydrolase MINDY n=1 Tax=Vombatus ursinus TaxID=29139 RepID=A0A4X2LIX3_VOMUR
IKHLSSDEVPGTILRIQRGLKKTSLVMDQEHPRGEHSINNRNELRKVLHLEMLYKENKVKKNPLKTSLEIITSYFLDHFGKNSYNLIQETPLSIVSASKMNNKLPLKCSVNSAVNNNNTCEISPDHGKNRHGECDGDMLGNTASPKRPLHKSKTLKSIAGDGNCSPPAGRETIMASSVETPKMAEPSSEVKKMGDVRLKPGLLARGILSGPITNSQEDPLRKRFLRRLSGLNAAQSRDQDPPESLELSLTGHVLSDASAAKNASSFKKSLGSHSSLDSEKRKNPSSASDPLSKMRLDKNRLKDFPEGKATVSDTAEKTGPDGSLLFPCGSSQPSQGRQEKAFKWNPQSLGRLCAATEVTFVSLLSLQVKLFHFLLFKEIKTVLFGSALCGFNEEWKLQNFTFSEMAQLKYGLVQNKGGPCGVLAAVQGCVLKNLLFGGESRRTSVRELQPSDAYRTNCLITAMADILWRAGGGEKAVVTLASGMQQFSPVGKYKADGVLEMLILHKVTKYEDLVVFLRQNIHQFQTGPSGCILLTLSAILSRSTDLVRRDFDMPANCLIGAHGYCTQELVNLLLTGKAVSNVFNDVVELDSGNGNVTLLKGITSRSDIGLLSLFEHYDVCQVGCYLKTPRYPIWVVCSESHFSILFSLQRDLLSDWKVERIFDLYYYDGLANQQGEIRLTIGMCLTLPPWPRWLSPSLLGITHRTGEYEDWRG